MRTELTFGEYSSRAATTDNYTPIDGGCHPEALNAALSGVSSKASAVAATVKRLYKLPDPELHLSERARDLIERIEDLCAEELGDLLWYMDLLVRTTNKLHGDQNVSLGQIYCSFLAQLPSGAGSMPETWGNDPTIIQLSEAAARLAGDEPPDVQELQQCSSEAITSWLNAIRIALVRISSNAGRFAHHAGELFASESRLDMRFCSEQYFRLARKIFTSERLTRDVGEMIWHIDYVARYVGRDLHYVAESNLIRAADYYGEIDSERARVYEEGIAEEHRFPRQMSFKLYEVSEDEQTIPGVPTVRMQRVEDGTEIGDLLDNNSDGDDGYRYHDAIHLAHAAVLGWSPVLRRMLQLKRRETDRGGNTDYREKFYDQVEDGARAMAIEEGLVAFTFQVLDVPRDLYGQNARFDLGRLDSEVLGRIKQMVRGLEVRNQPVAAWRDVYQLGFSIFQKLREQRGGIVHCDLDERKLEFEPL